MTTKRRMPSEQRPAIKADEPEVLPYWVGISRIETAKLAECELCAQVAEQMERPDIAAAIRARNDERITAGSSNGLSASRSESSSPNGGCPSR